ncbi:MAG: hypothetical protein HKN23_03870 [Verrucomicrobiales bacterium]|nr:hypothetical protein [Verrucomicrobiales bacterium]
MTTSDCADHSRFRWIRKAVTGLLIAGFLLPVCYLGPLAILCRSTEQLNALALTGPISPGGVQFSLQNQWLDRFYRPVLVRAKYNSHWEPNWIGSILLNIEPAP